MYMCVYYVLLSYRDGPLDKLVVVDGAVQLLHAPVSSYLFFYVCVSVRTCIIGA